MSKLPPRRLRTNLMLAQAARAAPPRGAAERRGGLTAAEVTEAYGTYGSRVRRRCLALLRSPEWADDATQEVFLRLWRYGVAYREAASPLGWLHRVAHRCCLDLSRRRRAEVELPANLPSLDEPHRAVEERAAAAQILSGLEAHTRQVAIHYYLYEMTQGEIAAATGRSRQTVNKRIGQALAHMTDRCVRRGAAGPHR